MATYRQDMRQAWDRINSFPTHRLQTRFGMIEYADQGQGVPLLVSHGVLGCHVDTVDSWWANLPGPGFRVIGPSRFGYFGSSLPTGATPAGQADAYELLLGHLGVDQAVVIGFSAGSGSILEFARRHPQRVIGLILACCRLGRGITVGKAYSLPGATAGSPPWPGAGNRACQPLRTPVGSASALVRAGCYTTPRLGTQAAARPRPSPVACPSGHPQAAPRVQVRPSAQTARDGL